MPRATACSRPFRKIVVVGKDVDEVVVVLPPQPATAQPSNPQPPDFSIHYAIISGIISASSTTWIAFASSRARGAISAPRVARAKT